jgi:muramidase (phage lysozyme)
MNSAIAAASLLGFGDKPASEALQGFSKTLDKLHDTQSQKVKSDEKSRKSVLDEYNKSQRAKKRRESDFSEFMKNLKAKNEGQKVKPSEGKKGGGNGLLGLLGLGLLGTMGTALIGKLIFDNLKGKLLEFINPVIDLINERLQPIYDFVKGIGDKIGDVVEEGTERFTEIVNDIKEFFGIPVDPVESEMAYFGDDYKEQELALAAAAEESRNKTSSEEESRNKTSSEEETETKTSSEQSSNTSWSPVLDMIASAESNGRYDIIYGGEIVDGITEMTIAQAAKRAGDRGDGKNYAVGKYQFITLTKQAEAAGLDPQKDKFSPANQDKIAIHLIEKKRKITKQMAKKNPTEAAKRLAMEWAGLPVLKDTKGHKKDVTRGQSYYAGDGVNKATVTPEAVEASFQKLQKGGITKQISSSGKMMSPVTEMVQKQQQFVQNQQKRKGKNGTPSNCNCASSGPRTENVMDSFPSMSYFSRNADPSVSIN